MNARVDRDLCIGAANCVAIAPTVFQLDDERKAIILDVSSVDEETLMEAAESCPTNAIIVEEDDGRQIFP